MGLALPILLPHYRGPAPWHLPALLVGLIALIPVHEGLHALGLIWTTKLPPSSFRFGMMWKALTPYCHCKVPVNVRHYLIMGLFPLVVTGSISIAALLAFPSDALGTFTGAALAACVGDIWMAMTLRKFPKDAMVRDCPSDIGYDVYYRTGT